MHTTPISLLEKLRQPRPDAAWERFVNLYTPLLCHWARRLGAHETDVADLVQDVFAVLAQTLPTFQYDPAGRFRGWLWTITANKWRERVRKTNGRPQPLDDSQLAELATISDEGLEEQEYREYLINRALKLMQSEFHVTTWKAFWECTVADRPGAEVAEELGISLDSVYAAKSRVLRRLRRELEGLL